MSYHKRVSLCPVLYKLYNKVVIAVGKNDVVFNLTDLQQIGFNPENKRVSLYIPYYDCVDPKSILDTTNYCKKLNQLMINYKQKKFISGKILYKLPGGYVVKLLNLFSAFLPLSQTNQVDLQDKIGQLLSFQIINLNLKLNSIVLKYKVSFDTFIDIYHIGTPVTCVIKQFNPKYGLFVQLKSIDAFIHNFTLPADYPKSGTLKAYISYIDKEKKRVYLSLQPMAYIEPGTILKLVVDKIVPGGLVCLLEDKNYAYVASKYISWVPNFRDNYKVGSVVYAAVLHQTYIYYCSIKACKTNLSEIEEGKVYKAKFLGVKQMAVQCGDIRMELKVPKYCDIDVTKEAQLYLYNKTDSDIDVHLKRDENNTISATLVLPDLPSIDKSEVIAKLIEALQTKSYSGKSNFNCTFDYKGWTVQYQLNNTDISGLVYNVSNINPFLKTITIKSTVKETTIGDLF